MKTFDEFQQRDAIWPVEHLVEHLGEVIRSVKAAEYDSRRRNPEFLAEEYIGAFEALEIETTYRHMAPAQGLKQAQTELFRSVGVFGGKKRGKINIPAFLLWLSDYHPSVAASYYQTVSEYFSSGGNQELAEAFAHIARRVQLPTGEEGDSNGAIEEPSETKDRARLGDAQGDQAQMAPIGAKAIAAIAEKLRRAHQRLRFSLIATALSIPASIVTVIVFLGPLLGLGGQSAPEDGSGTPEIDVEYQQTPDELPRLAADPIRILESAAFTTRFVGSVTQYPLSRFVGAEQQVTLPTEPILMISNGDASPLITAGGESIEVVRTGGRYEAITRSGQVFLIFIRNNVLYFHLNRPIDHCCENVEMQLILSIRNSIGEQVAWIDIPIIIIDDQPVAEHTYCPFSGACYEPELNTITGRLTSDLNADVYFGADGGRVDLTGGFLALRHHRASDEANGLELDELIIPLYASGEAVEIVQTPSSVYGSNSAGNVFIFSIDQATGDYNFTLNQRIDHSYIEGESGIIYLSSAVSVIDGDGDRIDTYIDIDLHRDGACEEAHYGSRVR